MSKTKLVTKDEALKMLSAHLRKQGLSASTTIKLLLAYAEISRWNMTNLKNLLEDVLVAELKRK